jgi:hypothetical protein
METKIKTTPQIKYHDHLYEVNLIMHSIKIYNNDKLSARVSAE